jgi:hypothetical protein
MDYCEEELLQQIYDKDPKSFDRWVMTYSSDLEELFVVLSLIHGVADSQTVFEKFCRLIHGLSNEKFPQTKEEELDPTKEEEELSEYKQSYEYFCERRHPGFGFGVWNVWIWRDIVKECEI